MSSLNGADLLSTPVGLEWIAGPVGGGGGSWVVDVVRTLLPPG